MSTQCFAEVCLANQGYDEASTFFADLDHPMPMDGRLTDINVSAMVQADEAVTLVSRKARPKLCLGHPIVSSIQSIPVYEYTK